MTGFTNWVRRVLWLSPRKDLWAVQGGSKPAHANTTPADVKIRQENDRQIEVKIVYNIALGLRRQVFQVELFIFFPSELGAVDTGFYHNLWQVVRLHTPQASVASLAQRHAAPGSLLQPIATKLQEIKQHPSCSKQASALVGSTSQLIRLQGCMFRRAVRRATKHVVKLLKSAQSKDRSAARLAASAAAITLVDQMCAAIDAFKQVCSPVMQEGMPQEVQEAWLLVDEFVLCEAQRALLKLLRDVDSLPQPQPPALTEPEGPDPMALPQRSHSLHATGQEAGSDTLASQPDFHETQPESLESVTAASLSRTASKLHTVWIRAFSLREATIDQPQHWQQQQQQRRQQQPRPPGQPTQARKLVLDAISSLEDARRQAGYLESVIADDDKYDNEKFTNRIRILKRHAQAAISLSPTTLKPSTLLADVVGMCVAGIAMGLAVFSLWAAQHWGGRNQWGIIYIIIIVVGYIIKDRLKEWGKRYLQPVAAWFGLDFPDRIIRVEDLRGHTVGRCRETVKVMRPGEVDKHVLALRDRDVHITAQQRRATRPEKVLHYRRMMDVRWRRLDTEVQGVTGLSDVLQIDLGDFCRKMQKPTESHPRLTTQADGSVSVCSVPCARVYHINIVLRVRAQSMVSATATGLGGQKLMQMQKVRVIMNRDGVCRLEPAGSILLAKPTKKSIKTTLSRNSVGQRPSVYTGYTPKIEDSLSLGDTATFSIQRKSDHSRKSSVERQDHARAHVSLDIPSGALSSGMPR